MSEPGLSRFVLVVYTNPVAGREDEYNAWYDGRHLDDLRRMPGVVAARRFDLYPQQLAEQPQTHRYLALYELEIADIQVFFDEMNRRSNTDLMPISVALADDALATLWKAHGD
jgi:hypothetical protein